MFKQKYIYSWRKIIFWKSVCINQFKSYKDYLSIKNIHINKYLYIYLLNTGLIAVLISVRTGFNIHYIEL